MKLYGSFIVGMPQYIIQTTSPRLLSIMLMEIKLFILVNSPGKQYLTATVHKARYDIL